MKKFFCIFFEIMPLISPGLVCFLMYKYGDSSIIYDCILFALCIPCSIQIGLFGDYLKEKYDDYFEYNDEKKLK